MLAARRAFSIRMIRLRVSSGRLFFVLCIAIPPWWVQSVTVRSRRSLYHIWVGMEPPRGGPRMARVECFPTTDALMAGAAERFVSVVTQAIHASGRFVVALAGGSTPKRL